MHKIANVDLISRFPDSVLNIAINQFKILEGFYDLQRDTRLITIRGTRPYGKVCNT